MPPTAYTLLVGSYAPADRPGIYAFAFDGATGALTSLGATPLIANPSFLAVHPNRRWLYAVSETAQAVDGAPGAVWALRYDLAPWRLEPINAQPSGGDHPCHLALDPSGRWLIVSNYTSGSLAVLPLGPDGALGATADHVQHRGHGPHPERQGGPHAHSAAFAPGGCFVLVADLGIDQILVYRFDASNGRLTAHTHAEARPGAGPRHLAFHPNGEWVYVANELDSTVGVYAFDAAAGALRERQVVETLPPGAPANTVADIHLSPDATRLYVSNRGHNSLAVFAVAPDGRLARMATPPCGGDWPRNFAVAPDGRFLIVANQYSGEVVVLPALESLPALGAPAARAPVPGAAFVAFEG
jgi:6-phosphogluconolactonase